MNKSYLVLPLLLSAIVLTAFQSKSSETSSFKFEIISNFENSTTNMEGKAIFLANGCMVCHDLEDNKIGPSVKDIAKAYVGKKAQLILFLKRESKPIVEPEDYAVMSANLFATKRMKDKDLSDLADFILSIK